MKKFLIGLLALFVVACGSAFAADYSNYNYPWQNLCASDSQVTAATATLGAFVSFEALNDGQNVIIDFITIKTDKGDATVYITTYAPTASAWIQVASAENVVVFDMSALTGASVSEEVQTLGSRNSMIPLWVADAGEKVQISVEGTTIAELIVNARRGTNYPAKPSSSTRSF